MFPNLLLAFTLFFLYPYEFIDNEFRPYYNDYMKIYERYCQSNPLLIKQIKFKKLDGTMIGLSTIRVTGFTIDIDPDYWEHHIDQRLSLMYHELSHSLIAKDHVDDKDNYMYPVNMEIPDEIVIRQADRDIEDYCYGLSGHSF